MTVVIVTGSNGEPVGDSVKSQDYTSEDFVVYYYLKVNPGLSQCGLRGSQRLRVVFGAN